MVAETTTTTVSSSSEEQRLNALSGQVYNLQKQTYDNSSDIKQIEKQIVVAVPAPAGTAPVTIGEHVGVAETNIAAIQKNLSDNLGIAVHAMVDAGYEHSFNQPNNNVNTFRAWDEDGFTLTQGNLHIERDGTVGFVTDINVGQVANSISGGTTYPGSGTRRWSVDRSNPVLSDLHCATRVGCELRSRTFRDAAGRRDNPRLQRPELQREPRPVVYPGRTADPYRHPCQLHVQRLRSGRPPA